MNTYYLQEKSYSPNAPYETSCQSGMPVECYKFKCNNIEYCYTSRRDSVTREMTEYDFVRSEVYQSEYIERSDITPGSKGSECEMTITVSRDNPVALLYKGAPPDKACTVEISRTHINDLSKFDVIYMGSVTQVSFEDNKCELTITLENWLNKEVPNGIYQYYCNNLLYDCKCRLNQNDWITEVFLDRNEDLVMYSDDFAKYPDGYFTNGKMYFNDQVRLISEHQGDHCKLKYPFLQIPRNRVKVTAGCDRLFSTCVKKFKNQLNFSGFPYCPPTDSEKNPFGKGVYWVDSSVVKRDTDGYIGDISL